MTKLETSILFLSVLVLVTGCSTSSPIEKVSESKSHFEDAVFQGRDYYQSEDDIQGEQYRIFHQASTGFSGTGGIRSTAVRRAKEFCRKKGSDQSMVTVSEHTAAPPYVLGNFPRIEIIFVCTDNENLQVASQTTSGKYEQIAVIKRLLDDGALTQSEFDDEKIKILSE
jgi:hypothetical protein